MIFPCESVYGNIEIKTKLDINSLQLSIDNIASLKSLYREDATEFNITPKLELTIGGQRLGKKSNNYFGVIFAYESSPVETIMKNLMEVKKPNELLYMPDLIVILDKEMTIFKYNVSDKSIVLSGDFEGYIPINTKEDTFAFLVLYLLTLTYNIKLKSFPPGKLLYDIVVKEGNLKVDFGQFVSFKK